MASSLRSVNPNAESMDKAAALFMNINAAKGLQDVMKTNLGPRGTIKMLVDGAGGIIQRIVVVVSSFHHHFITRTIRVCCLQIARGRSRGGVLCRAAREVLETKRERRWSIAFFFSLFSRWLSFKTQWSSTKKCEKTTLDDALDVILQSERRRRRRREHHQHQRRVWVVVVVVENWRKTLFLFATVLQG